MGMNYLIWKRRRPGAALLQGLPLLFVLGAGCSKEDKKDSPGASLPLMGTTAAPILPSSGTLRSDTASTTSPSVSSATVQTAVQVSQGVAVPPTVLLKPTLPKPSVIPKPVPPSPPRSYFDTSLVNAMNDVRRDPAGYAKRLQALRNNFNGYERQLSNGDIISTDEGWSAVDEAIQVLRKTRPLPLFAADSRLAASAREHVNDIGPKGLLGHNGSNGEYFADRIQRFLGKSDSVAENIQYGVDSNEEVVMAWLIDDGVYDRGHRVNLLNGSYNSAGTASGPHRVYRQMYVADYARE